MRPAAELIGVSKRYVKYEDVPALITGLAQLRRGRRGRLWAVRDLSLRVEPGEALGVIGVNGSGKSTTLAMLAGITAPTEGTVRVRGRIAPLLRLGVGFHDELTGRENVFLNAAVLGMSPKEVNQRFEEIVAFAEIGEFIDTPVKFYSSGMQVRLGFATAVAANPDVLLVDEVLAVGDIGFQQRCFRRMEELQNNGTTLIVVSHNLSSIHRLCSRVLLVDHGRAQFLGPTVEGISAYHELLRAPLSNQPDGRSGDADPAEILEFELIGSDERPTLNVSTGEDVTIRIRARFTAPVDGPSFGIWLLSETGQFVYGDNTLGSETGRFEAGSEVVCTVRVRFALPTGTYYIGGGLGYGKDVHERVRVPDKAFHVVGRPFVRGVADLEATFDVDPQGRGISSTATDTPTTASDPRGL